MVESKNGQGIDKRILEVGAGKWPSMEIGQREIKKGEHYVSLDIDRERLVFGNRMLTPEKIEGKHSSVVADAQKLPFDNDSFNEIVFNNIFDKLHIVGDYKKILSEAQRVLKPGGKIIINAVYTPGDSDYLEKENFSEYGLTVVKDERNEEYFFNPEQRGFQIILTKR